MTRIRQLRAMTLWPTLSTSRKRNGMSVLGKRAKPRIIPPRTVSHEGNEILPLPTPRPQRAAPIRFFNPWVDLANVSDDAVLALKVDSVTRTFGVVAGLMCSLSAAALAVTPSAEEDELAIESNSTAVPEASEEEQGEEMQKSASTVSLLEHIVSTDHVAGTSLLVNWGVPAKKISDCYSACCASSFYSSVCAMGLSAVLNAWLGCTPAGGTRHFVRYHSLVICAIPGFLALSTGLAGMALFLGLDRSKGTPISYIGLAGTAVGGLLIGSATVRGMMCTYRLLTPLVKAL